MNITPALQSSLAKARAHPLATAIACGVLIFVAFYFGGQFITGIRQAFENHQVNALEKQSEQKQAEAEKSLKDADAASVDRKAEDLQRERNIKPAMKAAAENSEVARARARKAETNYEKARTSTPRTDIDLRVLHSRNCADLHELYPGEPIDGCGP
jgi:hypothetical protein